MYINIHTCMQLFGAIFRCAQLSYLSLPQSLSLSLARAHTNTNTNTHTYTHTQMHADHTHTQTHTLTHTHTHTHTHANGQLYLLVTSFFFPHLFFSLSRRQLYVLHFSLLRVSNARAHTHKHKNTHIYVDGWKRLADS